MVNLDIPVVWLVVGVGLFLSVVGNAIRGRTIRQAGKSPFGRAMATVGFVLLGVGLYAGFRGPLKIGPVTLETFSLANKIRTDGDRATAYARSNLEVGSSPSAAWRGSSNSSLQYTVKNKGDRDVSCLIVRFRPETGVQTIELTVNGPFPAGRTSVGCVVVPSTVNRCYFRAIERVDFDHIVGARF